MLKYVCSNILSAYMSLPIHLQIHAKLARYLHICIFVLEKSKILCISLSSRISKHKTERPSISTTTKKIHFMYCSVIYIYFYLQNDYREYSRFNSTNEKLPKIKKKKIINNKRSPAFNILSRFCDISRMI